MGRAGIVAVMAAVGLIACNVFHAEPQNRPIAFLEALIASPIEENRVRELSDLPSTEGAEHLVRDLPTKVALEYLRTRRTQGVVLSYEVVATQALSATVRKVQVKVLAAPVRPRAEDIIQFRLEMQDMPGRGWQVTDVQVL